MSGAMLQSYAGNPLMVNWAVPANLFPGRRTQSVTVNLVPPGSKYLERWNQRDLFSAISACSAVKLPFSSQPL